MVFLKLCCYLNVFLPNFLDGFRDILYGDLVLGLLLYMDQSRLIVYRETGL